MAEDEDFDGFITREGERISIKDADRISAIFLETADIKGAVECLCQLAKECCGAGHFDAALTYIKKVLPLVDAPGQKAECFLRMGLVFEAIGDYKAAEEAYSRSFDLPQEQNTTWYFLNNNRGFCLNQTGRYREAERYCRAAITIEPDRHNAHKNLGVALAGLGRYAEAAKRYIRATKLCPADSRAMSLLDELFACHKEIVQDIPDFLAQLLECHELVQKANGGPSLQ